MRRLLEPPGEDESKLIRAQVMTCQKQVPPKRAELAKNRAGRTPAPKGSKLVSALAALEEPVHRSPFPQSLAIQGVGFRRRWMFRIS